MGKDIMKIINRVLLTGAGLFVSLTLLQAQTQFSGQAISAGAMEATPIQASGEVSAQPDSIVQLTAQSQGLDLLAPADVPNVGTFWTMTPDGSLPPFPMPPKDLSLPVYQITDGQFIVDATGGQVTLDADQATRSTVTVALATLADSVVKLVEQVQGAEFTREVMAVMGMDEEADARPSLGAMRMMSVINNDELWLEITNVANGYSYYNLHNATNQVYAILTKTNLLDATWNIETELFPTVDQTNVLPFTLANDGRDILFVRAMDWTGVTHGGNSTPDWWLWEYFDTTALSDTNLDSIGQPMVNDYQNHIDPNIIFFSLQFPSEVQNGVANGAVTIIGGQPFYEAVLINDTNIADAVWQPYSGTNIPVILNSGNGVYTVRVGLRGLPPDATTTWVETQLTLFQPLAPAFVIISPATATVSQPMIQLQGQFNENLSSLTFDVSNAAGVFTNQSGSWQPAFYDATVLKFTTNNFQCYDVQLTNGLNTITLNATDLAGNSTTTNVSFTLDYSAKTNPPALHIVWPQAGTQISGSNFTLQAQVDEATATITASILNPNGDTNVVSGLVERSGQVWVNNLPLAAGTNTLTVKATDAAGNSTTTNLTLIQSGVLVTMDPLASDQMNQSSVTVTGTINAPGYCVYVNGIKAEVNDADGTWGADGVAVSPTGTASFDVEVYVGDPVLVGSQIFNLVQSAVISLMSYTGHYHSDWTAYNYCDDPAPHHYQSAVNWLYQSGGANTNFGAGMDGDCNPYNNNWVTVLSGGVNGYSPVWEIKNTSDTIYDPPVWDYLSDIDYWDYISEFDLGGWTADAHARVMVVPSGQQSIGQTVLYLVQAQVMDEDSGLQLAASAVQFLNQLAGTATADVTNSDGSIWTEAVVSGAPGANVEVTPQTSVPNYSFTGMKISKLIYISVDPSGKASTFDAQAVQKTLQSELSSYVFDGLPAGQGVQVKVHVDTSFGTSLGWNKSKQTYVTRITWGEPPIDGWEYSEADKTIISLIRIETAFAGLSNFEGTQFWVNSLAHESIWLNAGGQKDHTTGMTLFNPQPDGDISSGHVNATSRFDVSDWSHSTIRGAFGF